MTRKTVNAMRCRNDARRYEAALGDLLAPTLADLRAELARLETATDARPDMQRLITGRAAIVRHLIADRSA